MDFWQTHMQGDEEGEGSRLLGILFAGLLLASTPDFWTSQLLCRGLGSNMVKVAADPEGVPSLELELGSLTDRLESDPLPQCPVTLPIRQGAGKCAPIC